MKANLPRTTVNAKAGAAVVIDTRPVESWAAAHIPDALAIPLRPQFASWLGWLVEWDASLVFVVGADQDRAELVRQCHQVGFDHIAGELAIMRSGRLVAAVTQEGLSRRLRAGAQSFPVDLSGSNEAADTATGR